MHLRGYQEKLLDDARSAHLAGARRVCVQLPTGGGKSAIIGAIGQGVSARGKSLLALAHRTEIVGQLSEKLHSVGVEHGVIAPGHPHTDHAIQVGSVQTVARRLDRIAPPSVVVLDEAHHAPASNFSRILGHWPAPLITGFTATPCRLDGKGLDTEFDALVQGPDVEWLTSQGFLVPARLFAPDPPDLSGVGMKGGDFDQAQLQDALLGKPHIVGDALAHFLRHRSGPGLAFCAGVKHAEAVRLAFATAGLRTAILTGKTPKAERASMLTDLALGNLDLLASCETLTEGADIPSIGTVLLLRPTKSVSLYLQMVGRALRPAPDKTYAIILDHGGLCFAHGLPDEPREWTLAGGAARRRSASEPGADAFPVRQCPKCWRIHPSAPTCPSCGHTYTGKERVPRQVQGTLKELTRAARQAELAAATARAKAAANERRSAIGLCELVAIGRSRGYSRPEWWAQKVFESRSKR